VTYWSIDYKSHRGELELYTIQLLLLIAAIISRHLDRHQDRDIHSHKSLATDLFSLDVYIQFDRRLRWFDRSCRGE
jgi:hypothetical protein